MQIVKIATHLDTAKPFFTLPQTTGAYPTISPTGTIPQGDGVIELGGAGYTTINRAEVMFYGVGSEDQNFYAQLIGWFTVSNANGVLWVPRSIMEVLATLGTKTGVGSSGYPILSTHRFAKTLAIQSSIVIPVSDTWTDKNGIAGYRVDLSGYDRVQFVIGTGSATSGNALLRGY